MERSMHCNSARVEPLEDLGWMWMDVTVYAHKGIFAQKVQRHRAPAFPAAGAAFTAQLGRAYRFQSGRDIILDRLRTILRYVTKSFLARRDTFAHRINRGLHNLAVQEHTAFLVRIRKIPRCVFRAKPVATVKLGKHRRLHLYA